MQRCLQDFANKKWKGSYLDVQLAKKSFLSRLKREREGGVSKISSDNTEQPSLVNNVLTRPQSNLNGVKQSYINSVPNKKIIKYDSESSDSGDKKSFGEDTKGIVSNDPQINGESDIVIKNNKFKTLNGSLKIESFHSKPNGEVHKKETKKLDPEHLKADQKRKQSLIHMRQGFMQQKSQIKAALANVNVKPTNKITFDTDDAKESRQNNQKQAKKSKVSLFDESDEDEDFSANFEIKKQFEGKKGQKLLELQSKFKNDSRFAVDERFLEDDDNEDGEQEEKTKELNEDMTYEEEKEKQFGILEEVLGVKVNKKVSDEKSRRQIGMLRFDPSQPEHNVYEIKTSKPETETKSKRKRKLEKESTETKDPEEPEVSKTKFYKVTEDLKGVFQKESNSGFSLLSAFKQNETTNDNEQEENEPEIVKEQQTQKKKKIFPLNIENPFRYDSSDEDENREAETTSAAQKPESLPSKRSKQLWTEPFFFGDDDYRLQEGFDFIKRLEVEESTEFSKVRGKLKEIIRAKVRNVQRKNKMFKKKLGGRKKRIKMKKALKK